MNIRLIINPRSGKRKAASIVQHTVDLAASRGSALDVVVIEKPGDGTRFAREAVATGVDRIICAGGDGTLNAVAAGTLGSGVPIGIVPMGSGNGYARSLKLPLEPIAALQHALHGTPNWMDVCTLNGNLFLGTAGIGFDARVAHQFDRSKKRGMIGYMKIIVKEILGAPPMHVKLQVDDKEWEEDLLMLVFCNTREFGNGADISPGSRPDDGIAELRLVRKPPLLPLIKAFMDIYSHKADSNPYLTNVTATSAHVWQAGVLAHLDGEPIELGHEIEFRLEPKKLCVIT